MTNHKPPVKTGWQVVLRATDNVTHDIIVGFGRPFVEGHLMLYGLEAAIGFCTYCFRFCWCHSRTDWWAASLASLEQPVLIESTK